MSNVDLSKKYNFKIRHKETGKFITGNKSKSTWMRPSAVCDRLKGETGYRIPPIEKLEVVLFPLEDPLTVDAEEFLDYHDTARQNRINAKKNKEKQLSDLIYQMGVTTQLSMGRFYNYKELHEKKILAPEIQSKLGQLIIDYTKLKNSKLPV